MNRTLQDRLVKELALAAAGAGIKDLAAASQCGAKDGHEPFVSTSE